jgi:hypothetical protein
MSEQLDALQAKYDAATEAFRKNPTAANKRKFKEVKTLFATMRQGTRRAEGRREGTGVA